MAKQLELFPAADAPLRDQVHGKHYKKLPIDPYEYAMRNGLNALQFNIVKYVTRCYDKNGIADVEKAVSTALRLIDDMRRHGVQQS